MNYNLYFLTAFLVIFSLCIVQSQSKIPQLERQPLTIGETIILESQFLKESRTINIYLPNSYTDQPERKYPVIYLFDGGIDEDFIHIVGLVQYGSFPWIKMLPQSIVVGIANVDRKRDFTYPSGNALDQKDFPTSGKSEAFIQFLEQELQPAVKKTYRIGNPSTLIGQSLGGLLATEILLKKPETFDNYIIVSPSLWWDDEKLLEYPQELPSKPTKVFVAVGKEGEVMERTAQSLYQKLENTKSEYLKTHFHFLEEQDHSDALHLAVYYAIEKIFAGNE